jgi:hypothetical protein
VLQAMAITPSRSGSRTLKEHDAFVAAERPPAGVRAWPAMVSYGTLGHLAIYP